MFREYINQLALKMRVYYPGDKQRAVMDAKKLLVARCVLCALSGILVFSVSEKDMAFPGTVLMVYSLWKEIGHITFCRLENRFLKQLGQLITELRHHFYADGNIRNAVNETFYSAGSDNIGQAQIINSILAASDPEKAAVKYMTSGYHRFYRLLISLIVLVEENGDDNRSDYGFIHSLDLLRADISEELRRKNERERKMMGLSLLTMLPLWAVRGVGSWAIGCLNGLDLFFHGIGGSISRYVLLLLILCCYMGLSVMRYGPEQSMSSSQRVKRRDSDRTGIGRIYGGLPDKLKKKLFSALVSSLFAMQSVIGSESAAISIVFILSSAVAGYCLPGMYESFSRLFDKIEREREAAHFRLLISIQKDVEGMTVLAVLENLYEFSSKYRAGLRECIDFYGVSETEALNKLYKSVKDAGFRRIVEGFMAVDENGLKGAFSEIEADLSEDTENNKLENRLNLERDGMMASALGLIPGGVLLFLYLLVPFVYESMKLMKSFNMNPFFN